jgi:hypothetical protein
VTRIAILDDYQGVALSLADWRVIAWSENLTAERARECGAELVARQTLLRRPTS